MSKIFVRKVYKFGEHNFLFASFFWRKMGALLSKQSNEMQKNAENMQKKMEEMQKNAEEMQKNAENMQKNAENMQKKMEELQQKAEERSIGEEEISKAVRLAVQREKNNTKNTFSGELVEKTVLYCLTLPRAIVCLPSNLLTMSIFAPSRYESKLWNLKNHLRSQSPDPSHVRSEIITLCLYGEVASYAFGKFLVAECNQLDEKYSDNNSLYELQVATDWELIRNQSARYGLSVISTVMPERYLITTLKIFLE